MAFALQDNSACIDFGAASLVGGTSAFTFAAWIRLGDTSRDMLIALRGSSFHTSSPLMIWRDESASASGRSHTLSMQLNTDAGQVRVESATDSLNDTSSWHHVAAVFEAGTADGGRLFVDGVRDAFTQSTVGATQVVTTTADVSLGISDASKWFDGEMAEVAVWHAALDDQQIARLAAGCCPLGETSQLASLMAYQDLIRLLNRPGIGPAATTSGTIAVVEHPRVYLPHGGICLGRRSQFAGHPVLEAGEGSLATAAGGEAALCGAATGMIVP